MKCQHVQEYFEKNIAREAACTEDVAEYRQCGAGCKLEIGYCPAHGGIERATEEMKVHHKTHDVKEPVREPLKDNTGCDV